MDVGCTGATDVPWHTVRKPLKLPPAHLSPAYACRSMCVMSNMGCSITQKKQTKKTGDKKTPLSGAYGLCVHVQKKEICVQKWRWFDILVIKYFFLIPALRAESFRNGWGGWKCQIKSQFFKKCQYVCLSSRHQSIMSAMGGAIWFKADLLESSEKTCLKTVIISEIMYVILVVWNCTLYFLYIF